MQQIQTGILQAIPAQARYLSFVLESQQDLQEVWPELLNLVDGERTVVGLGYSLVSAMQKNIDGLKVFPAQSANGIEIPSTPAALWIWLRGEDRGELVHRSREIAQSLSPAFRLEEVLDGFRYGASLDLTGYEDGTENPQGNEAIDAACVQGQGEGMDGSSFVVVQQWLHELDTFELMPQQQQDHTIGRRKSDNEELDDAPESAHVKRTAQESFEPQAFILRRSMPWSEGPDAGLVFVAFGKSFAAYESLLYRMMGLEDGITDALFSFSQPLSGAYFWCPPMKDGRLDLSALGITL